jgi:environmental stress-induced protein Ves
MATSVIRAKHLVAKPWKNGTGVTREIDTHPPGAGLESFAWRISLADVADAGPFSQFDGVDRTLVLLAGEGLRLTQTDGRVYKLSKLLDVVGFPGDSRIEAELVNGPTRDFNLMVSRKSVRADLTVWRGGPFETQGANTLLLFCAQGHTQIVLKSGTYMLDAHDTLRIDDANEDSLTFRNFPGSVLAIRLYYYLTI